MPAMFPPPLCMRMTDPPARPLPLLISPWAMQAVASNTTSVCTHVHICALKVLRWQCDPVF